MANVCLKCKHNDVSEFDAPCTSCSYDAKADKWTNFTPYKDLNQVLREKLGEPRERIGNIEGFSMYTTPLVEEDVVNKPSHYMLKPGLEVRDVLECLVGKFDYGVYPDNNLFVSDYVQMMQYGMRFMDKGGKQDLQKMRWYLDKLIEAYDDND